MNSVDYPRDMIGYGRTPPHPNWPRSARIAVQFVINYEEGGENNILHGDPASEHFMSEVSAVEPLVGKRNVSVETMFEYGSRAGFWRLYRLLTSKNIPVTIYGVSMALERNPEAVAAMKEADWEIASHGLRWIDYQTMTPKEERSQLLEAIKIHTRVTGSRPLGWFTGRGTEHTQNLVAEEGGFAYCSDSYADDLPYWERKWENPLLIIPYCLDNNDMRFVTGTGFSCGEDFFTYLRDAFDLLYAEGELAPKMMNIGLHGRIAGRPGRTGALARFIDHILKHDDVWVCRRIDIANHWIENHKPI
jgi:putative urate catabolism protein|tara:strand:- start:1149 stop:2060 length:912 start_codon:yes stop_codon:yes gene_type:complete